MLQIFQYTMKLKLRKGLNLNLKGALTAEEKALDVSADICAVVPDDFPGFIPKLSVKEGDNVAVGSPLFYDKIHPSVKVVSPVSGRVKAVVRGERRKILRVEIESADVAAEAPRFAKPSDRKTACNFLAESGLLAFMRKRPYDIVPDPDERVRDIFITAIDDAPLAASLSAVAASVFSKQEFEAAVALLSLVTDGKVYFSHKADSPLSSLKGTEDVVVEGNYPAGNVGVQIANIKPVDKGDVVLTLDVMTLGRIGRMLSKGVYDATAVVALVGPEVAAPTLYKTLIGASIAPMLKGTLNSSAEHKRIIAGNVFTGTAVMPDDAFLRFPYRQVTVIAEGDDVDEFMGWASLSPSKMSVNRSFPGHFFKRLFSPDARLLGGRRAMIMSGEYDSVFPMDIMPEYLIKAILSHNIEDMEKLGIYEVAPEDFAAAEYVDTSKLPLQKIVREGLDYLRKELE